MVPNRSESSQTAAARASSEQDDQFTRDGLLLEFEKLLDHLAKVNQEENEKIFEIEQRYDEKRKSVYAKRNEIISSIPNFWLTAFMSHPTLGSKLTKEDKKIFTYLESLSVEDFKDFRHGYRIIFNFKANPYFENTSLTKTIQTFEEGMVKPTGTTVSWKEGMGPLDKINDDESFFNWFSNDPEKTMEVEEDEKAGLSREELWPNPMEFFNHGKDGEFTEEKEKTKEGGKGDNKEVGRNRMVFRRD